MVDEWTVGRGFIVASLSVVALLYAAALAAPARIRWAGRAVAGLVFVAFALYAIHEWFFTDHRFRLGPRSEASPRNSLLGLLMVGVPCLIYALRGGRKPPVRIERNFADRPAVDSSEIAERHLDPK